MPQAVNFQTKDGVNIQAVYCPGNAERESAAGGRRGVLLLHMMPATKESWTAFKAPLVEAGFSVLAIDLRGHGQSTTGPLGEKLLYQLFEDRDHQASANDVEAAADWLLAEVGISRANLALVGASIGANLAIGYAAAHSDLPVCVALSPGWDYHGVTTPDKVEKMRAEQRLYLAASEEDQLSFQTNRDLAEIKPDCLLKEFRGAGHGTSMFQAKPEFIIELSQWLIDNVPALE